MDSTFSFPGDIICSDSVKDPNPALQTTECQDPDLCQGQFLTPDILTAASQFLTPDLLTPQPDHRSRCRPLADEEVPTVGCGGLGGPLGRQARPLLGTGPQV